ncbi:MULTISPECIES: patatin-like phospholipase family protein [Acidithrix]|uniref:patatin-like phospholipase family protein n=1 Tax=Acidithrix TaxID=1609233 RepID=UPI000698372A|nr:MULTISPECIES: patatin-like phospholipase family protein [Acidithrix]
MQHNPPNANETMNTWPNGASNLRRRPSNPHDIFLGNPKISSEPWWKSILSGHQDKTGYTAFILSGGGNRGAAQVGMLSALLEHSIFPDFIIGASAGALNGTSFAISPSRQTLSELFDLWTKMTKNSLFPPRRFGSTWRYAQRGSYVYSNDALENIIREHIHISDLKDTQIPVEIVVTDLLNGEPHRFHSGDPTPILLASSALPGTFSPIEINGKLYIDGGIADDVPIRRALTLGANKIYVLYCSSLDRTHKTFTRPIEAVLDSFTLAKMARLKADIADVDANAQITVFESRLAQGVAWLDFSHAHALIEDGYKSALEALKGHETAGLTPTKSYFSTHPPKRDRFGEVGYKPISK